MASTYASSYQLPSYNIRDINFLYSSCFKRFHSNYSTCYVINRLCMWVEAAKNHTYDFRQSVDLLTSVNDECHIQNLKGCQFYSSFHLTVATNLTPTACLRTACPFSREYFKMTEVIEYKCADLHLINLIN